MIYIYIYIHIHTYIYINVYEQRHTKIGQGYTSIVCACMCVRVCTGVRVCACVCVRARACVRASAFLAAHSWSLSSILILLLSQSLILVLSHHLFLSLPTLSLCHSPNSCHTPHFFSNTKMCVFSRVLSFSLSTHELHILDCSDSFVAFSRCLCLPLSFPFPFLIWGGYD